VWDGQDWNNVGPIQGPEGPQGEKGDKGDKGDQGDSVSLKGSVQEVEDLDNIQGPEVGDLYVVVTSGDGYIYDGTNWNNIGPLRGPEGPQGIQGILGSRTYNVTNSGASAYLIDGASNPTIQLLRGFTYEFDVDAVGHPF
jgi:hypothetical protein